MKSVLLISVKKDEILLKVNEDASFEKILELIDKKMPVIKKLYNEAKNPIKLTGKIFKEKELEEIKKFIKDRINVDIMCEEKNELGLSGIKKAYEQNVENSEAYFYKGAVRSGQRIESEGMSMLDLDDTWAKHNTGCASKNVNNIEKIFLFIKNTSFYNLFVSKINDIYS